ncbi:acyl carrier protein [Streptomyces boluensis]|uniref:Acyl carrier protein n=1 Tax=Streptomyces boluensis TaxID=1775135 RepID=A0A964UPM8_9ACTN|nr:acyl carrier protein [Streptomyces boluensis]NBE50732.1 acyl carrier protein [Streptomyces boluensis]
MSVDFAADATGTVDGRLFDCVQVNLAVLADRWHGPGTHLRLGAALRFRPAPGTGSLPTVEEPAAVQLERAAGALGLTVRTRRTAGAGEVPAPAEGRYVVADAFHLPWVPYFGQRHMDHSFLLEPAADGGAVVVDGYHNETPWGSARPVRRPLDEAGVAAAVPAGALVVTFAPDALPPSPHEPELDLADEELTGQYVAAYAEHEDRVAALHRLTLETWLLARARKLHARFLAGRGALPDDAAAHAHVQAWETLAESIYLGYRRAERGRPEARDLTVRLAEQLHHDREVFGSAPVRVPERSAAAPHAPVPDALRASVAAAAGAVLRADPVALLDGYALADVPGFTSFRVVEIVERLERELSLEFDADDLVPENLHHVDGICRIVLRARTAAAARLGGI